MTLKTLRHAVFFGAAVMVECIAAPEARAFKVETHVWLASQIVDELSKDRSGSVTLTVDGRPLKIKIPRQVRRAILAHPEAFKIGSIGPDAMPGILEGQATIHPGAEPGWGTGDWLRHLLKSANADEEIAFVYGFITHAAADTWAHSYVNHYAGNAWDLLDDETTVETRHMLLEGYIARHTDWGTNNESGGTIADRQIRRNNGNYAIPKEFLFRIFIEDLNARKAFSESGTAPHLVAVGNLYDALGSLTKENSALDKIHLEIQKLVVLMLTDYQIREAELKKINDIHQKFLNFTNKSVDKIQDAHDEIRSVNRSWMKESFSISEQQLEVVRTSLQQVAKLNQQKQGIELDIVDLVNRRPSLPEWIPTPEQFLRCVKKVAGVCILHVPDTRYVNRRNTHRDELENAIAAKHSLEGGLNDQIDGALSRAQNALISAHDTMLKAYDVETVALRAAIDFGQRFEHNNPIKGVAIAWRSDIQKTMQGYFDANVSAMSNSMRGEDVIAPLSEWLSCQAPALVGIPSELAATGCAVSDAKAELLKFIDLLQRINPIDDQVAQFKELLRERLTKAASDQALRYASDLTGADIKSFITALSAPADANNLNQAFATAPVGSNLIVVADMAKIVDDDMHLPPGDGPNRSSKFTQFHPMRNAAALMRLSLMDSTTLNSVFTLRGPARYRSDANVMYTFSRSIDGDYQWMNAAVPYARSAGAHALPEKHYGYGDVFPLWKSRSERGAFRQVFTGPLNEGSAFGQFGEAIPPDYKFRPTTACAYPTISEAVACN